MPGGWRRVAASVQGQRLSTVYGTRTFPAQQPDVDNHAASGTIRRWFVPPAIVLALVVAVRKLNAVRRSLRTVQDPA